VTSHAIARRATSWRPPFESVVRSGQLDVGMIVGWDWAAWEITHLSPMVEPDDKGRDTHATLHRLHGPKHRNENKFGDLAVSFTKRRTWDIHVYRDGRVWLCSCCGDPAPCRMQVAEESSRLAAEVFEDRLNRMGTGICYACGEVITARQERVTFPGEHADFPGRSGPTFHTRRKCASERYAYARRAGTDTDGNTHPTTTEPEGGER
jgi:hypothetical protein